FGLFDWEETVIADDPGFKASSPLSRLDAFFVHERGGLRFTEYNAETPAGASYNDILAEATLGLPAMRAFMKQYEVRPLPSRHNVMHALLDAWQQFSGQSKARPRIAILDWSDVPTYSEFVLTQNYLHDQGIECVIADPRDVEYRNGKLVAEGVDIDLIYKRVLINELVDRCGLDHAVVRAVRERAVCMVNPFRCKILHKKASLAMLSDEAHADMFDRDACAAITRAVPWTRVVRERKTTHDGEEVDLIPFIVRERQRLVLKPNDDYGGRGITLGWTVNDTTWERAVQDALAAPHIVQERVEIPSEPYPSWVDGQVELLDRQYDTAPFVSRSEYMEGLLTRLSTSPLLNVTAGGGSTVPTFLAEPR
ncbi:MAG TPA: circularly permuted type 2 ATP-grasp protein, partial [Gemmatimonadaceae bacterium]|nr:circularly permuted type 2 ATP-grasp protein [Gemmatimonadaceae bacterium]